MNRDGTDEDLGRDLAAFLEEHRACGTLATGLTGQSERVWLNCSCGARIERLADEHGHRL